MTIIFVTMILLLCVLGLFLFYHIIKKNIVNVVDNVKYHLDITEESLKEITESIEKVKKRLLEPCTIKELQVYNDLLTSLSMIQCSIKKMLVTCQEFIDEQNELQNYQKLSCVYDVDTYVVGSEEVNQILTSIETAIKNFKKKYGYLT